MSILFSFLPWILFFILASSGQHLVSAISVAAISSVLFELKGLRKKYILSWGTALFFTTLFVSIVIFHNYWILQYIWILSNGMLAAIAWGSLLLHRPFTYQYAKEQVPKEKWGHPVFIKINYILTSVWGMIFLVGVGINLFRLYNPQFNGIFYELTTYLPTIFGIWFTTWFPGFYRRKANSSS